MVLPINNRVRKSCLSISSIPKYAIVADTVTNPASSPQRWEALNDAATHLSSARDVGCLNQESFKELVIASCMADNKAILLVLPNHGCTIAVSLTVIERPTESGMIKAKGVQGRWGT
jgi:hypothetical protein